MEIKAKQRVNIRSGEPRRNGDANLKGILFPGFSIEIAETIKNGETIDGNSTWFKDKNGDFYWSGGFRITSNPSHINYEDSDFWWHHDYGIPELWKKGLTGKGVKIAVLDSGVSLPHPDLIIDGSRLCDVSQSGTGTTDHTGHGTHISGILKASNNGLGVKGIVYDADYHLVKITNDLHGDKVEYLIEGIKWAISKGVDIISISNGDKTANEDLEKIINEADSNGILVICAAGNKSSVSGNEVQYPAKFSKTLSVGGVDRNEQLMDDTINALKTDLFAPGHLILSTYLNKSYKEISGSSQAAPFITGVAGQLLEYSKSQKPAFRPAELKQILIDTAINKDSYKLIDPLQAYKNLIS